MSTKAQASASKRGKGAGKDGPRTLQQFILDQKRAQCAVCRLPANLREEIRTAGKRKYHRAEVLQWLVEDLGIHITSAQLDTHYSGKHEPLASGIAAEV